jgi:spore maturation protein CgeB
VRLLYVTSGRMTLSDLTPSIVQAFEQIEKEIDDFAIKTHYINHESKIKLIQKIQNFKPEVIVVFGQDSHPITKTLKNFNIPIGLWVVNDPYNISNYEEKVQDYDFMITEESSCVSFYEMVKNRPCIHFPLAVNPKNYYAMELDYKYDICFIGMAWPDRIPFIDAIAPKLSDKKFILIGKGWEKLKQYHRIKGNILDQIVKPNEAAKYYNQSKIVLNIHRAKNDVNKNPYDLPANTPNNRTFDIAACKAFQLLTYREDLNKFFKLEKEIVSYKDETDLLEKIEYYLKNDTTREEIADKAYQRTMHEHTYYARVKAFIPKLNDLTNALNKHN